MHPYFKDEMTQPKYTDYAKLERMKQLENKLRMQQDLPHLYGHKLYPWQREFLESMNPLLLLTAANQIGKSSIQIKKHITLATSPQLWPKWWPKLHSLGQIPRQFWYLYPDSKVATAEYHEKWVPEFLPRGAMKDDPVYGWNRVLDKRQIQSVHFNSGVTIYFKTYAQQAQSLQSGTVSYIGCDEELPYNLYDELKIRLSFTDGYYSNVFTATLNQEFWRCAMEEKGKLEKFPDAKKMQISLYDCMYYEDGTESTWTKERIEKRKADCGSEEEVQRRIYGKFVRSTNRKYVFSMQKNVVPARQIPKDWYIYTGVDIGTGGKDNHPAAIVFVAVSPDFAKGEVFLGWRGDDVITTAGDILTKYLEMREPFDGRVVEQRYDYHSRDFLLIADRIGETFLGANKKHDEGEEILNTLFKHEALLIHDGGELPKMHTELTNLLNGTDKRSAIDDFTDALRYCCATIPWNMEKIKKDKPLYIRKELSEIDLRRAEMVGSDKEYEESMAMEVDYWNRMMGN